MPASAGSSASGSPGASGGGAASGGPPSPPPHATTERGQRTAQVSRSIGWSSYLPDPDASTVLPCQGRGGRRRGGGGRQPGAGFAEGFPDGVTQVQRPRASSATVRSEGARA